MKNVSNCPLCGTKPAIGSVSDCVWCVESRCLLKDHVFHIRTWNAVCRLANAAMTEIEDEDFMK